MKIKEIHIKNFKGIADETFTFNDHFTVLIGENGSGKTSILDAISLGLDPFLSGTGASYGPSGSKSRPLRKHEVRTSFSQRNEKKNNKNKQKFAVDLEGKLKYNNQELCWKRFQSDPEKQLNYKHAKELKNFGNTYTKPESIEISIPLIAYHSTSRLAGEIHEKVAYQKKSTRLDGYYACLDPRSIKDKFLSWFKTYEDQVLKFDEDKELYNAFCKTITSLVDSWSDINFDWGEEDLMGKIGENEYMPLSYLSDGYRCIISLAADIAYRAIKLNPHLGENAIIDTEGIVLIDELDLHLHPKWQKNIVSDLKRVFPKIQFIVTTHSPFIVQSLRANEVINLDNSETPLIEDPINKSIEEIAGEDMGVDEVRRSNLFMEYQNVASEYFQLIEEGKSSESDEVTAELKERLDQLELEFSNDPVYLALMQAERNSELGQ